MRSIRMLFGATIVTAICSVGLGAVPAHAVLVGLRPTPTITQFVPPTGAGRIFTVPSYTGGSSWRAFTVPGAPGTSNIRLDVVDVNGNVVRQRILNPVPGSVATIAGVTDYDVDPLLVVRTDMEGTSRSFIVRWDSWNNRVDTKELGFTATDVTNTTAGFGVVGYGSGVFGGVRTRGVDVIVANYSYQKINSAPPFAYSITPVWVNVVWGNGDDTGVSTIVEAVDRYGSARIFIAGWKADGAFVAAFQSSNGAEAWPLRNLGTTWIPLAIARGDESVHVGGTGGNLLEVWASSGSTRAARVLAGNPAIRALRADGPLGLASAGSSANGFGGEPAIGGSDAIAGEIDQNGTLLWSDVAGGSGFDYYQAIGGSRGSYSIGGNAGTAGMLAKYKLPWRVPATPVLTSVTRSGSVVTAEWLPSTDDGGFALRWYNVLATEVDTGRQTSTQTLGTEASLRLTPGTWSVGVSAYSYFGYSPSSNTATIRIGAVSLDAPVVREDAGVAWVTVSRNDAPLAESLAMTWSTAGATPTPPDYVSVTNQPVTLPANATSVKVPIRIVDDQIREELLGSRSEKFLVTVTYGTTTFSTLVTIVDND